MTYWNVPVEPVPAIGSGVLRVKRLTTTAKIPTRGSEHAAGLDLYADESSAVQPGEWAVIGTGIALAIPPGHVGLIWPRSGLAVRYAIDVLAGVLDSDYRGEVRVALVNHGLLHFQVSPGERIAQLLIQPITMLDPVEAELDDTSRGQSGFGSTGK